MSKATIEQLEKELAAKKLKKEAQEFVERQVSPFKIEDDFGKQKIDLKLWWYRTFGDSRTAASHNGSAPVLKTECGEIPGGGSSPPAAANLNQGLYNNNQTNQQTYGII